MVEGSFPGGSVVKDLPAKKGDAGSITGLGRSPGEGEATHSRMLAWEIQRQEETGRLQSKGSQKSRTRLSDQTTGPANSGGQSCVRNLIVHCDSGVLEGTHDVLWPTQRI